MILANCSSSLLNLLIIDNSYKDNEEFNNGNPLDFQNQTPETSDYQNFNGAGGNLNVTVHQSLLNTSTIEFTNLDTSNNFTEPFPNFNGYNTSFVNMTIDGIYAPNHTLIVEDDFQVFQGYQIASAPHPYASFTVKSSCYLDNISTVLYNDNDGVNADIQIRIYNSTWNSGQSRNEPDSGYTQIVSYGTYTFNNFDGWYNFTNLNHLLNISKTANNTFYVYIRDGNDDNTQWRWASDTALPDNIDEQNAYEYNPLLQFINPSGSTIDLTLKVDLVPVSNTPRPEHIGLNINNSAVTGYDNINGSGYWNPNQSFSSATDELNFIVSADWWDVSCNITSVQINYTKTDVQAISSYDISGSGQIVQWNVTITNGLNYFDSRITDFNVINFTIPRIWHESSIKVFNGSTEKTIFKRLINNDYREIQVLNAGNGTYWYVNATSSNLFSSIDTFVSGIARDMVNHSNTVAFNITFSERIFEGLLNLSVFSPSPRYLNHTKMLNLTPLASDDEFHVTDWDVSVNVTEYGVFKIQMSWNNDTAAGFLEDYITVIADTDLILSLPKNTFDSGDTFNMTVFYNDTGQDLGIQADTINYQIGSGGLRTDNIFYIGNGYYNITFSCNDADFTNYGLNSITVNTYKDYFNNQTRNTSITILAETDANIVYPPDNAVFDSTDSIVLQIFYNNTVKDVGITGATINYSLDGGNNYIQENISPEGPGEYNITISASDSRFGGYGFKNIIVNCSKDYYYNQSKTVTIQILGITSITPQKIPDQPYYNSAETFNISIYYEDTAKSIGISGATIDVDVDGTVYNPPTKFDYGDGNYDVTIDCSDSIFSSYKTFSIRVNVTLENYYNQSTLLDTLIVGNVSLFAIAPSYNAIFIQDQTFNITIQYNDTILGVGIDAATIDYSLDDGSTYKQDNVNYIGEGKYNITIDVNDADFISYGYVNININASKQYYENTTTIYTFHRQIRTQISSSESTDLGIVIKGLNVTYTFDYEEFYAPSTLIREASWTQLSSPVGFTSHLQDYGNGTYTMHLDTTNVLVTGVPYVFEFNIFAVGNETQVIQLTVDVLIIRTEVVNVSYISEIARNSGLNQSLRFYFNDTTNNDAVRDLTTSNIIVKNYWTGIQFSTGEFWLTNPSNNGTYFLDITMGTRNSGLYTLEINASKIPNYEYTLFNITFYYRGNYTDINLISLSDPGPGVLSPIGLYNFTIFEGSDLDIEFNITDSEYFDNLIIGDADSYTVRYTNLGTGSNGILVANLNFITQLHTGSIITSNPALTIGRYSLNITTSRTNYEDATFIFNLTVIEKYQVRVNLTYLREIDAGDPFTIVVKAEFFNGTVWFPLENCTVILTPYLNNNPSTIQSDPTNSTGEILFIINVLRSTITMNLTIQLVEDYYHLGDIFPISDIEVTPLPPSFNIEDILPYLIMAAIALVAVVGSVAIYRGVVVPKKKEKQRILTEVKTIFDDAINLEHILVLYKGTGTCIFFKSYGSEQIDPELVGGFLSAVSSFGKEMATQEALNEISYGDRMLLLADGNLIRVALVLGKNASLILRRHLKKFIATFEKTYSDVLPNWRGQLKYFRNAGIIVDDLLNTSIILPHQISYDFSSVKDLKNPHSKDVLKVAQSCCEEAEREFFFIATLLKDASEMTNKDTAEIFMGIKELRDKKILIPIEISAIEAQPISQQELNLINQKVGDLSNLTSEEKQKLVQDLGQLGPIEREAYLSSLAKQQEIVTAPIKTTVEGIDVDNRKAAKRGIKELTKRGKIAKGKKDYINAVEIFESAAILASNWELSDDYVKIEETIRTTKIEDLKEKKTKLEKESKIAVKAQKYAEAATKYKYASKMASEIFKLGDTTMTKEVKRLTNKANEYEKLK